MGQRWMSTVVLCFVCGAANVAAQEDGAETRTAESESPSREREPGSVSAEGERAGRESAAGESADRSAEAAAGVAGERPAGSTETRSGSHSRERSEQPEGERARGGADDFTSPRRGLERPRENQRSELQEGAGAGAPARRGPPEDSSPPDDAASGDTEPDATTASAAQDAEETPDTSYRDPGYRYTVGLGFSHWYGETFGAPPGIYTPGITLGWFPLPMLELQLGYAISAISLELPDDEESHVGFATLALMLRVALQVNGSSLSFAGGIVGGMVHTGGGVGGVVGGAITTRYMVRTGAGLHVGPFIDARALLYTLAETDQPLYEFDGGRLRPGHSDAHIQIGVALGF